MCNTTPAVYYFIPSLLEDTIQLFQSLFSKEEIDAMDSGDESEDETLSTAMLEEICKGSKSHMSVHGREVQY